MDLLGVLPHEQILCDPTVDLIREELRAELLNQPPTLNTLVDDVIVGAMGAHNAMQFFRRGVLLITPGDREDILLAAGATTSAAKRGQDGRHRPDRRPAPPGSVLKALQAMPVPVLLAKADSYQVASKVHNLTVKTRPTDAEKISLIRNIVAKNVNVKKIIDVFVKCRLPLPHQCCDLKNLPVYQPGRPIEEVARELGLPAEGIIKVASNENPFGPSPLALAAMQKALAGVNLYPDGNAFYLKQKLAAKLGVEPANLILGNGSNEIIEFVGHALLAPGDGRGGFAILFRGLSHRHRVVRRESDHRAGEELRPRFAGHAPRHHAAHAHRVRGQPEQSHRHARAARGSHPVRQRRARRRVAGDGRGLH